MELNYDLCCKLKEARFPQEADGYSLYYKTKEKLKWRVIYCEGEIKVPTLGELIEACGEEFIKIEKRIRVLTWWAAFGYKYKQIICEEKIPSEAVAKLYLKLNKT